MYRAEEYEEFQKELPRLNSQWELPEINPCIECLKFIFATPGNYHIHCMAEDNEHLCPRCEEKGLGCKMLPKHLIRGYKELYTLRRQLFASESPLTRVMAFNALQAKIVKFSGCLFAFEVLEAGREERRKKEEESEKAGEDSDENDNGEEENNEEVEEEETEDEEDDDDDDSKQEDEPESDAGSDEVNRYYERGAWTRGAARSAVVELTKLSTAWGRGGYYGKNADPVKVVKAIEDNIIMLEDYVALGKDVEEAKEG